MPKMHGGKGGECMTVLRYRVLLSYVICLIVLRYSVLLSYVPMSYSLTVLLSYVKEREGKNSNEVSYVKKRKTIRHYNLHF